MSHVTEAAGLLQSGALYARRLGLRRPSGEVVFAGIKPGAFSLYFDDAPILHFDLEGRWQRAFFDGVHYLKGFDTTTQAIDRRREGANMTLHRRTLAFAEAADLDAAVRDAAIRLAEDLETGGLERLAPPATTPPLPESELRDLLDRIAGWDANAWFAHRERYLAAYGPLPFLPPDCQHAVVLQATLGHAGPTFGGGFAAEPYARTPREFEAHARAVQKLYGRRLLQCRSLVLAGADALLRPRSDLLAFLDIAAATFPIRPGAGRPRASDFDEDRHALDGVHAFLDRFEGPLPGRDLWSELRGRNLVRVHLGIESGDTRTREAFGRNWTDDQLREAVGAIKDAGIGVGVVVLSGLDADEHEARTADLIRSLPLGPGDLISLVDADEITDPAGRIAVAPLRDEAERSRRRTDLKTRLETKGGRGAKVATYSLQKQSSFLG